MPNEEENFDALPPAILSALRELDGPSVLPDAARDADVLSGARSHLAEIAQVERKRRNLRLLYAGGAGGAIAAAAMIAFVVFLGNPLGKAGEHPSMAQVQPSSPQPTAERQGDLNTDGTLDILDAYKLAKHIDSGDTAKAYDFNTDGRIDQRDIDFIALQAVALHTGERS